MAEQQSFHFGVVGLGRMGASIAGQLALQGFTVAMHDRSHFDRDKGWNIMSADLKDHVEQGMITAAEKDAALGRGALVETLDDVVKSAVVVEAIFEDLEAKRELFTRLESAAGNAHPGTIFATNSMNFNIMDISVGSTSAERIVCGLRFLHPVWFIPVVEVSGPWSNPPPSLDGLMGLLRQHQFQPFFYNCSSPSGVMRRRLDTVEISEYRRQQKQRAGVPREPSPEPAPAVNGTANASASHEASECVVCSEASATALFAPCGHRVMCMPCATRWWERPDTRSAGRPCPTCRTRVERLLTADSSPPRVSADA